MLLQDIIAAKRDGQTLSREAIRHFVMAIADDSAGNEQIGAFAMATYLNGMSLDETVALTEATRDSGSRLDYRSLDLPGPVLDKHSTGGVGDPVSLILGPWLAACGAHVPMISGRGLGHTGGTLDKLEAIGGYNVTPERATFERLLKDVGVVIVGQSGDLAPADKRLYAVRDVTATVSSLPLIVASILGKKLAENLDGLVMDVKIGNGAFLESDAHTRQLASTIADVARQAGTPTTALLTDMNQTLAESAGNAIEVHECLAILRGERRDSRLLQLTRRLAVETLLVGGIAKDRETAAARLDACLANGQVAERFERMVAGLGGPSDLLSQAPAHLVGAPVVRDVFAQQPGVVSAQDVKAIGMAVVALGGGRRRAGDAIDHRVGIDQIAGIGQAVDHHRPVARIHAASDDDAQRVAAQLRDAFTVADQAPALPLVHDTLPDPSLAGDIR
ncbi:thymidine phosphorylase [Halomonas sp. DP8Y7-3]|uniref:thymidine phosphorylase n=1 Tax=Halomonas sp. DP8Y7-3 TaxID=2859079 RepID=UPI001C962616|nr:thymidine phosphorylase [Halomonas sp. DP8Y7-3]MBY5928354.1 thymidine phosphorylase [Halomonas sp. DP8Y7-3]MED5295017.1 thymidine phosphorylase [Pseudomonadota bacterium]